MTQRALSQPQSHTNEKQADKRSAHRHTRLTSEREFTELSDGWEP